MSRFDDELIRVTSENAMRIAGEILEPLSRFLTVAREECDGDAEKVLLMVAIVLRASLHPDYAKLTPAQVERGDVKVFPTLGVNVASLSDSIGIPRETVRRKVRELMQAGWVVRQGRRLHYTREGYMAVAAPREALIRLAVRTYEVEARLVAALPEERTSFAPPDGGHAAA